MGADVSRNRVHIQQALQLAKRSGARLVHFTESALAGCIKKDIKCWSLFDWQNLECELSKICETAKELELWVVLGSYYFPTGKERPLNSLWVISDKGRLSTRYDKRFCSFTESSGWLANGKSPCVFDVDGFRFACALCIEIQFSEIFLEYEKLDTDCVLLSAYSNDPMYWTQLQGHAASNTMWMSLAAPSQPNSVLMSGIAGPNGKALARASSGDKPELVLGELNRKSPELDIALNKARPWRRSARSGDAYQTNPQ